MKFNNYLNNDSFTIFVEYVTLCEAAMLSEMSNEKFKEIKAAAKKLGLRVNRSDSLFDYLKSASRFVNDLFRSAVLYASTEMSNRSMKNVLKKDMKDAFKRMNKKEIAAFLLTLDKSTIGLTAHLRHILQGILGIEVTGYYQLHQAHLQNILNLKHELKALKKHLTSRNAPPEDMKIIGHFESLIDSMEEEGLE